MTQAPAKIMRSLEAMGDLQLHRLDRRVRIHCMRCQRDRMNSQVATRNGDWAQLVCIACYSAAFRARRDEVRIARENERRRRLSGTDAMLEFLGAGGFSVKRARSGCLKIDGSQTRSLTHLPPQETLEWQMTADELVLKHGGNKFIKAVRDNARFGNGLRTSLRQYERGIAVMRGEIRLAIIHPSRAQVPHQEVIYANFLVPGPHWQQVADVLHNAEPDLVAEWKREQEAKLAAQKTAGPATDGQLAVERRRIVQLPDDLAPELISACLDASQRVRLDRQVAYERPVILESDLGELTLLPITGPESRLLMPFRFRMGISVLQGELVLGNRDPLPLVIGAEVPDEDAITAWTCALLGFADATCIEPAPAQPAAQHERAGPTRPSRGTSHDRQATPIAPRRQIWPKTLEPVGHWARFSDSFVAGHRRRLNSNQAASDEACDHARQVGITLRPHETWVRPHPRGVPDNIEMRFRWHTSQTLKRYQMSR
jgi:hypothetical protein